jgi:hypothetical protein
MDVCEPNSAVRKMEVFEQETCRTGQVYYIQKLKYVFCVPVPSYSKGELA